MAKKRTIKPKADLKALAQELVSKPTPVPLSIKEDMHTDPIIDNTGTVYADGSKTYEEYVRNQTGRDPMPRDKVRAMLDEQTGAKRDWVMPDNSPEAQALRAASRVEEQKRRIFVHDDNAPVTVTYKTNDGPRTLAVYENMQEFRDKHDFNTYAFREARGDKDRTVILVSPKPWAKEVAGEAKPKAERKPREARDFSQPDTEPKPVRRESSLGVILGLMIEGRYNFEEIVAKSGVEGGVVSAADKVKHRIEFVLFKQNGIGHVRDAKGIIKAVLPKGVSKEKVFR